MSASGVVTPFDFFLLQQVMKETNRIIMNWKILFSPIKYFNQNTANLQPLL
jgi:hypothetical protein